MTLTAVTTTGIYCRPGCSGRPRSENVRTYGSAAAAEAAGFRACLRCRPYRAASTVDWAQPELVCRGVQLILAGALDDGTEGDLGRRLGASARHLRRLFVAHLGATPDQLARSRRVHFARRLLDDTDLSITTIAFASGFGSTRQLNRACMEIFRATPRELRARRRAGDPLTADGGLALRLPFTGGLDWDSALRYLSARAIPGVEVVSHGVYRRTISVDGDPGVLELERGGNGHLLLVAHLPHWEGLIHIVDSARRIFSLDVDPGQASAHLRRDAVVRPLVARRPDVRVPGAWDAVEIGVRAIVGQQISVRAANAVIGRIAEVHGTGVEGIAHKRLTHVFPSASALAGADLEESGMPKARARAIRSFAAALAGGSLVLDGSMRQDELLRALTAVPGVGLWTAQYIALRLGERDAFPEGDLGLERAAARLSPVPLPALAERWRPWRATAAVHLWLSTTDPTRRARIVDRLPPPPHEPAELRTS